MPSVGCKPTVPRKLIRARLVVVSELARSAVLNIIWRDECVPEELLCGGVVKCLLKLFWF